ncbi:hypothetical protein [Pseudomonas sp. AN3A02]|uniref:hypothetical protein n=1 Tax=Pseudomonas sp. AN3A02 TaxID=2719587 RepID=UPI001432051A|nr:hypothetical protein [Pseudomonas sp. AN3A02]NIL19750.1 hypothetical protein [Pseudomonas sp. AN3A02]
MTEISREDFEAAYAAEVRRRNGEEAFQDAAFSRQVDGEYIFPLVASAWWGWRTSRQTLLVDLPTVGPSPEPPEDAIDDSWLDAHHAKIQMRNACFEAVDAAGIKIAS